MAGASGTWWSTVCADQSDGQHRGVPGYGWGLTSRPLGWTWSSAGKMYGYIPARAQQHPWGTPGK